MEDVIKPLNIKPLVCHVCWMMGGKVMGDVAGRLGYCISSLDTRDTHLQVKHMQRCTVLITIQNDHGVIKNPMWAASSVVDGYRMQCWIACVTWWLGQCQSSSFVLNHLAGRRMWIRMELFHSDQGAWEVPWSGFEVQGGWSASANKQWCRDQERENLGALGILNMVGISHWPHVSVYY